MKHTKKNRRKNGKNGKKKSNIKTLKKYLGGDIGGYYLIKMNFYDKIYELNEKIQNQLKNHHPIKMFITYLFSLCDDMLFTYAGVNLNPKTIKKSPEGNVFESNNKTIQKWKQNILLSKPPNHNLLEIDKFDPNVRLIGAARGIWRDLTEKLTEIFKTVFEEVNIKNIHYNDSHGNDYFEQIIKNMHKYIQPQAEIDDMIESTRPNISYCEIIMDIMNGNRLFERKFKQITQVEYHTFLDSFKTEYGESFLQKQKDNIDDCLVENKKITADQINEFNQSLTNSDENVSGKNTTELPDDASTTLASLALPKTTASSLATLGSTINPPVNVINNNAIVPSNINTSIEPSKQDASTAVPKISNKKSPNQYCIPVVNKWNNTRGDRKDTLITYEEYEELMQFIENHTYDEISYGKKSGGTFPKKNQKKKRFKGGGDEIIKKSAKECLINSGLTTPNDINKFDRKKFDEDLIRVRAEANERKKKNQEHISNNPTEVTATVPVPVVSDTAPMVSMTDDGTSPPVPVPIDAKSGYLLQDTNPSKSINVPFFVKCTPLVDKCYNTMVSDPDKYNMFDYFKPIDTVQIITGKMDDCVVMLYDFYNLNKNREGFSTNKICFFAYHNGEPILISSEYKEDTISFTIKKNNAFIYNGNISKNDSGELVLNHSNNKTTSEDEIKIMIFLMSETEIEKINIDTFQERFNNYLLTIGQGTQEDQGFDQGPGFDQGQGPGQGLDQGPGPGQGLDQGPGPGQGLDQGPGQGIGPRPQTDEQYLIIYSKSASGIIIDSYVARKVKSSSPQGYDLIVTGGKNVQKQEVMKNPVQIQEGNMVRGLKASNNELQRVLRTRRSLGTS